MVPPGASPGPAPAALALREGGITPEDVKRNRRSCLFALCACYPPLLHGVDPPLRARTGSPARPPTPRPRRPDRRRTRLCVKVHRELCRLQRWPNTNRGRRPASQVSTLSSRDPGSRGHIGHQGAEGSLCCARNSPVLGSQPPTWSSKGHSGVVRLIPRARDLGSPRGPGLRGVRLAFPSGRSGTWGRSHYVHTQAYAHPGSRCATVNIPSTHAASSLPDLFKPSSLLRY